MDRDAVQTPIVQQEQQQTRTGGRICRDLVMFLFYMQLTLVSIFVIFLIIQGLLSISVNSTSFQPMKWYFPLLGSIVVSGVLSLAWQCFFFCNLSATLNAIFWFTPPLTISVGVFLLVNRSSEVPTIGILFILFGLAQAYHAWFYVGSKKRDFTIKMMSISTGLRPAKTISIVLSSLIFCIFYMSFLAAGIGGATCARASVGGIEQVAATSPGLDVMYICIIVVTLGWTMQVLKNVQAVAISKSTYVYYVRDEELTDAWADLGDIVSNQLGSVCIGSAVVPVVVLIRGTIRFLNKVDNVSDLSVYANKSKRTCNKIVNNLILCGNRWGFVHVGVYEKIFVQASSDTWKMFRTVPGLEEMIDCDLTSNICFLSATAVGTVSALTAGISALIIHKKDYLWELTLYAFVFGYFMGRVGSGWLQGCVLGYYVAYSEDPTRAKFDDTIRHRIEQQQGV